MVASTRIRSRYNIDATPEGKRQVNVRRLSSPYIRRSETNSTSFAENFPYSNHQRLSDSIKVMEVFQENHTDTKHESFVC